MIQLLYYGLNHNQSHLSSTLLLAKLMETFDTIGAGPFTTDPS